MTFNLTHPAPSGNEPSTCRIDGCDQPVKTYGLCNACYIQQWRGGEQGKKRAPQQQRTKRKAHLHEPNALIPNGVPEGHKSCTDCGEIKPLSKFGRNKRDGQELWCLVCKSNRAVDQTYGPGAHDWKMQRLAKNGYRCGWCRTDEPGGKGAWHLHHDHDHDRKDPTGWREVLCFHCNIGEGFSSKGWNVAAFLEGMRRAELTN